MNVSHKIYSMIQYKERLSRKDELEEKREKKLGLQLRTLVVMEDDRDDDVAEQVENEGLLAGRGGAR